MQAVIENFQLWIRNEQNKSKFIKTFGIIGALSVAYGALQFISFGMQILFFQIAPILIVGSVIAKSTGLLNNTLAFAEYIVVNGANIVAELFRTAFTMGIPLGENVAHRIVNSLPDTEPLEDEDKQPQPLTTRFYNTSGVMLTVMYNNGREKAGVIMHSAQEVLEEARNIFYRHNP